MANNTFQAIGGPRPPQPDGGRRPSGDMSYRMPFPIPFIPVVIVAVIVAIVIPALLSAVGARIREVHTAFLFNQIASTIRTNNLAQPSELLWFLRTQNIDWNSCSMDDQAVYDGWGTAIETTFANGSQLILVSAGKDKRWGTKDDITKQIRIENIGQPPLRPRNQ